MTERHDEDTEGYKGGASGAYPAGRYYAVPEEDSGFRLKDRVRWGPVWAGALLAVAVQVLLSALGVAIGLSRPGAASAPGNVSSGLGIWMAISALISLFLGGLFAAKLAGIAGTWNGIWNGVVVWAVALALGTLAASLGVSGLVGLAGNFLTAHPGAANSVPGVTPGQTVQAVRSVSSGATWFFIWGILALIAAALGGAAGARHEVEVTGGPVSHSAA